MTYLGLCIDDRLRFFLTNIIYHSKVTVTALEFEPETLLHLHAAELSCMLALAAEVQHS